ncbi:MAG: hypothetical protein IBX69_13435 [Anaerolineales bacterium]|nr:hypothetical protein [Anaerolineales bacterium]
MQPEHRVGLRDMAIGLATLDSARLVRRLIGALIIAALLLSSVQFCLAQQQLIGSILFGSALIALI